MYCRQRRRYVPLVRHPPQHIEIDYALATRTIPEGMGRTISLVRFIPVDATPRFDKQRYRQLGCSLHARTHPLGERVGVCLCHLEYKLVMNLHDHERVEARTVQPAIDREHGALDDVGRRALHGRVDGRTLSGLTPLLVLYANLREIEPAAEERFDIAIVRRLRAVRSM